MFRSISHALLLTIITALPCLAGENNGIGLRGGYSPDPDEFVVGGQMEFGPVIGPAHFLPLLDLTVGDDTRLLGYAELRWYLLPLPDSGVTIYASGGPGFVLSGGDEDVGLSLSAGAEIPMSRGRRYNVEARFGSGDLPDLTLTLAVVWGL